MRESRCASSHTHCHGSAQQGPPGAIHRGLNDAVLHTQQPCHSAGHAEQLKEGPLAPAEPVGPATLRDLAWKQYVYYRPL